MVCVVVKVCLKSSEKMIGSPQPSVYIFLVYIQVELGIAHKITRYIQIQ